VRRSSTAQTLSTRVTRRTSARLSSRRSRVFDPLDFLAEVSAHIPDAHEKTTLFYGWYSNPACAVHADRRTRGYRNQHGLLAKAEAAEPVPGTDDGAPLEVRRSCLRRAQARRARLIRQVYEVDPLLCPRCGGRMKVIAVIERPPLACLPAGRSGRFSPTWVSPPQRPAFARRPTRPASGPSFPYRRPWFGRPSDLGLARAGSPRPRPVFNFGWYSLGACEMFAVHFPSRYNVHGAVTASSLQGVLP